MNEVVQPQPVPITFQVAAVTDNRTGQKLTMLTVLSPTGQSVFFLEADLARSVGEALLKTSELSRGSGLVVAQAVPQ